MEKNESNKKRKVNDGDVEQESNELEVEMKIFFALIDNIREARLRLMNGSNAVVNAAGMDQNNGTSGKKKKRFIEEEQEKKWSKEMLNNAAVLKPALVLQRQDLQEEAHQFKVPTSQISRGGEKGKSTECNLDLTLSL